MKNHQTLRKSLPILEQPTTKIFPTLGTLVPELLDSMFLCINRNFIIICSLTDFNKNWTNNWKNIKLWRSHYQYLNNPQLKLPCFRHFGSWVIRLNVSMYKYKLYHYMLFDGFKKNRNKQLKKHKTLGKSLPILEQHTTEISMP